MSNRIQVSRNDVSYGIEKLIQEQKDIMEKLNKTTAYTKEECEQRLYLMARRDMIDQILRSFGIQSFQFFKEDYNTVEIS